MRSSADELRLDERRHGRLRAGRASPGGPPPRLGQVAATRRPRGGTRRTRRTPGWPRTTSRRKASSAWPKARRGLGQRVGERRAGTARRSCAQVSREHCAPNARRPAGACPVASYDARCRDPCPGRRRPPRRSPIRHAPLADGPAAAPRGRGRGGAPRSPIRGCGSTRSRRTACRRSSARCRRCGFGATAVSRGRAGAGGARRASTRHGPRSRGSARAPRTCGPPWRAARRGRAAAVGQPRNRPRRRPRWRGWRLPAGVRLDVLVRVNPAVQPETHGGARGGRRGLQVRRARGRAAGGHRGGRRPGRAAALARPPPPRRLAARRRRRVAVRVPRGAAAARRSSGAACPTSTRSTLGSGFPVDYGTAARCPRSRGSRRRPRPSWTRIAGRRPAARGWPSSPAGRSWPPSGWLVGRVLHVRDRDPRLVVLDAGMTELIRPALYGAEHPMVALTSLGRPVTADRATARDTLVRVDGPVCESTDRLGVAALPPLRPRRPGRDRRGRRLRLRDGLDLQRPATSAGDRLGRRCG